MESQSQLSMQILEGVIPTSTAIAVNELSLGSLFASANKNFEMALKFKFGLSSLIPRTPIDLMKLRDLKIRRTVEIGHLFLNRDLAIEGAELIKKQSDLIPKKILPYYIYISALSLFFQNESQLGVTILNGQWELNPTDRKSISWESEMLTILFYIKLGDFNFADSLIERRRKKSNGPYQSLALRMIKKIYRNDGHVEQTHLDEFHDLKRNIEPEIVGKVARLFNMDLILKSMTTGLTPNDLYAPESAKSVSLAV